MLRWIVSGDFEATGIVTWRALARSSSGSSAPPSETTMAVPPASTTARAMSTVAALGAADVDARHRPAGSPGGGYRRVKP